MKKNVYNRRVIVASHVYGTGASQDLVRFFVEHKTQNVLFISHPLFYGPNIQGSGYELYVKGKKSQTYFLRNTTLPLFLGYAIHIVRSLRWVIKIGKTWDIYIGSNNLNALVGLILRAMGRVKKVVYYVIDFNPERYDNFFINSLYQRLDQYCVRHADETWNMSPRMEEGRKTYFGFTGGNQKVVPVGLWTRECVSLPFTKIHPHTVAFIGHVQEKQGVQYVIRAIPAIVKKIPDFKFLVIGGGDYVTALKILAGKLHVSKYLTCTDFVADHKDIDTMLAKCALGVALYRKQDGNTISFSYFGNPTKVKTYFAAGIPVVMTDVPYNAQEIARAGCGLVVSEDPKDIAETIVCMIGDPHILQQYRTNVITYRKKFDWNEIFRANLLRLL